MRRPAATLLATAALTAGLGGPGAAVALAAVGDDQPVQYPGSVQPGGEVQPERQSPTTTSRRPVDSDTRGTLPFTGGELVALVTVGAGAVGAGAALVVSTRRRSPQSA